MSWKDRMKSDKLALIEGEWVITFLDEGKEYEFSRGGETKYGVSFKVDAKHVDTGKVFKGLQWGVTAGSILNILAQPIEGIKGRTLELVATGTGTTRRYPKKELRPATKQSTVKPKK